MGSKRWQLENGLGEQLRRVVKRGDRFVDLFAGSGAVSHFVAEHLGVHVTAVDLQQYAVALSGSIIARTRPLDPSALGDAWIEPARAAIERDPLTRESRELICRGLSATTIRLIRQRVENDARVFNRSYAGYYFSPEQALSLDFLWLGLPTDEPERTVCLAALITAASRCSASPGHTAQPLKLTERAIPHIQAIWRRNVCEEARRVLMRLAPRHASQRGVARKGEAIRFCAYLDGRELVFIDPPYSAAQYSRFYHVLEAVAAGGYIDVYGEGRAPSLEVRESSAFSLVSSARESVGRLLSILATKGCRVIATFPQYRASNGLAGEEMVMMAREWFHVDVSATSNRFSTLGGNGQARAARRRSQELVITMFPKG